ncbi:unnamed protein product [Phyllotreta striolata]|uniref:Uncharacterized protein n=1 Tax=Phyllotreta striolata TaxID=444603 RepID=A0A9N9TUU8_PHYSR|nr:unnamed protein product [Phyllotreta striolata]
MKKERDFAWAVKYHDLMDHDLMDHDLMDHDDMMKMIRVSIIETEKKRVVIAQDIQAVEGKSVSLPCDVIPPGHDKVYMVFWFQYGSGFPIYR